MDVIVRQTGLQCYCSGESACSAHEAVNGTSSSTTQCMETVQCVDEDADNVTVSMPDADCSESIVKQRRLHSSALLKKEQKLSAASVDVFVKVGLVIIVSLMY